MTSTMRFSPSNAKKVLAIVVASIWVFAIVCSTTLDQLWLHIQIALGLTLFLGLVHFITESYCKR